MNPTSARAGIPPQVHSIAVLKPRFSADSGERRCFGGQHGGLENNARPQISGPAQLAQPPTALFRVGTT